MVGRCGSAIKKLRIVTLRFGSDRKWSLNDGQIPNVRGVRVHVRTGYNTGQGNPRASRNGGVSDLPPEIPTVTIRHLSIVYESPYPTNRLGGPSSPSDAHGGMGGARG
jgi:hypothetical protein